jgi:hypothetical protein
VSVRSWLTGQLAPTPGRPLWRRLGLGAGVLVLLAAAVLVAVALGSGTTAVLAAMAALFTLIGAFGGSLRADLRVLAWFAPAVVLVIWLGHSVAAWSPWWGLAVLLPAVAVAGALSAAGPRARAVGSPLASAAAIGVGLTSVSSTSPTVTFVACAVGAALVVLWRVVRGIGDPTLRTRQALAAVFSTDTPAAVENAWHLVRSNPAQQWMVDVLLAGEVWRAAGRAQQAWSESDPETDPDLESAAQEVAEVVAVRRPGPPAADPPATLPPASGGPVARARALRAQALERAAAAARARDDTLVRLPAGTPPLVLLRERLLSWRSPELLHTVRGVLAAAVVGAVVARDPTNPLNPTMLATSVSLLQPSLRETAGRLVQRTAGTVAGVAVSLLLLGILPDSALLVAAVVAVALVFASLGRWMPAMYASTAVMAILLQSGTGRLDPFSGPWLYLLDLLGVIVATLVIGVLVVPGPRRDPAELAATALGAAHELVAAATAEELLAAPAPRDPAALRLRHAATATTQVVGRLGSARLSRDDRALRPQLRALAEHLEGLLDDAGALGVVAGARSAGEAGTGGRRDEHVRKALGRVADVLAPAASSAAARPTVLPDVPETRTPGLGASMLAHAYALRVAADRLTPTAAPTPAPGRR